MRSELIGTRECALFSVLAAFMLLIPVAQAQTFNVVYNFTGGSDGGDSTAGLVRVGEMFYGTTESGGSYGAGAVFKVNTSGKESSIYSFTGGADGSTPDGGLLYYGGSLYGTTSAGGASGAGTVFEVTPLGHESVVYSFTGGADGSGPQSALVKDSAGNLYGTTFSGGTYGYGTVFELEKSSGWTENILHVFQLQNDGGVPYAGVILDAAGNVYGASTEGGAGGQNGGGTIFKLTPSSSGWSFEVIYGLPGWGISGTWRNILMKEGNIYGTTHCDGIYSAGTIYELSPSGSKWNYTQLYTFTGDSDGLYSVSTLAFDKEGNLWGTTRYGGTNSIGVVFKLTP